MDAQEEEEEPPEVEVEDVARDEAHCKWHDPSRIAKKAKGAISTNSLKVMSALSAWLLQDASIFLHVFF